MLWEVQGANSETGEDVRLRIDAPNVEAATQAANRRGVFVTGVKPAAAATSPAKHVAPGTGVEQAARPGTKARLYGLVATLAVAIAIVAYFVLRPSGGEPPSLADGRGQPPAAVPTSRPSAHAQGGSVRPPPAKPMRPPEAATGGVASPTSRPVRATTAAAQPPQVASAPTTRATVAAATPSTAPAKPVAAPISLGLTYDDVVKDLADQFPLKAKKKLDGTPMYEGLAANLGILHIFGDKKDISSTSLAILMPQDEQRLTANLQIAEVYLRNVVTEMDSKATLHWFQQGVLKVAQDDKADVTVRVGRKSLSLKCIPTNEGLLAVVAVVPAPAEQREKTEAESDLEKAMAHRAAVQRKDHKRLGLTYDQVLAGAANSFDMQPAPPADGLPGYYGSTKNGGLNIRLSGEKGAVAEVRFTFVLGGETRDGVVNMVAMTQVVLNVCPEWKSFLDWFNENKKPVLDNPKKPAFYRAGGKVVKMSGLRNADFGAEMLFLEIAPAD